MPIDASTNRSLSGRAGIPILLLLIATAVFQSFCILIPQWLSEDLYAGDAAQHVWWMYRFADPALFPNDPIAAYYSLWAYSPPGYQALFRVLCVWGADPQRLAEAVAIVLALAAIGLTAALGACIGKKTGAVAAVAVYLVVHGERLVEGGFPRSFGLVLVLAGVLALYRRWWTALGLVFAISPLLYAPTVLNLAPVTAAVLAVGIWRYRRLPRGFWNLAALGSIGAIAVGLIYLRPLPAEVGPWFSASEARKMAEWRPSGRTAFFRSPTSFYFTSQQSGLGLTRPQTIAAAVALLIGLAWRPRAVPLVAWALLAGALIAWAAAHLFLFKLYLPNRYTMYALPVFAMMWAAAFARQIKVVILARGGLAERLTRPIVLAGLCVFCVFTLAAATRVAGAAMAVPPFGPRLTIGQGPVLEYLRTLPADTRIAADPDDANSIPLFARRSVLANTETSVAFNKAYYLRIRERIRSAFDMLYATDWTTIDAVATREGATVFVLDRRRLTHPDERPYYEPFRSENRLRIDAGRGRFALLDPPPGRVLMSNGEWVVLRVGEGAK
ncbi:MAG TPA: hypothetical protein VF595_12300 [Tepidisphaeraceae bacterium]|jgi:hypothetical protein